MATMLRTIFEEDLVEAVQNKMNREVRLTDVERSNGEKYKALVLTGESMSAAVNVDTLYYKYLDIRDEEDAYVALTTCVDKAVRMLRQKPSGMNFDSSNIKDWNKIKEFVFPRLVPDTPKYRSMPHLDVADLLIVFSVRAFVDSTGIGEAVITSDLVELWKRNVADIYAQAMHNLEQEEFCWINMLDEGFMYVVTNKYKTKGAIECLNPKVIERAKSELGEFYIVPSSLDEVLFIPKAVCDEVEVLRTMLNAVNTEEVEEKDRLSFNIYELVNKKLEVVV